MNILYCGDVHIVSGLALSAISLKNHVDEPLHIYILTMSLAWNDKKYDPIPEEPVKRIEAMLQEKNPRSSVQIMDISDLFLKEMPSCNMGTRFTPYCMLRLYADLLPLPDKILYLDTDVLCRHDPLPFYDTDLKEAEVGGILDHYGKWFFHQKPFCMDYMNSGVLLLNMKRIRQTGLFRKCRQYCRSHQMFMPDQSALNKLVQKKVLFARRYNEQRKVYPDTVFQHFTTSFRWFPVFHTVSVKPWDRQGMHETLGLYEYDSIYDEYDNRFMKIPA